MESVGEELAEAPAGGGRGVKRGGAAIATLPLPFPRIIIAGATRDMGATGGRAAIAADADAAATAATAAARAGGSSVPRTPEPPCTVSLYKDVAFVLKGSNFATFFILIDFPFF